MPLPLPNLDDRTYTDLMEEARRLIPTYAPEWTNHNPSDPGITLIELFAYLTEMLIYRLNRVTDANLMAFLRLLNGPEWVPSKSLNEEIRDAVLELRRPDRAVTCTDFENLALAATVPPAVARAHCVPRRNLEFGNIELEKPDHVSVVIVPQSDPQPTLALIETVKSYLEPRRLLTTRVHVVGPRYVKVGVRVTLFLKPDAKEKMVRDKAIETLKQFLHPLTGGPEGRGWPFGRNVYVSEIYQLLDTLPGVDYVEKTNDLDELTVSPSDSKRLKRNDQGALVAVDIQPHELVDAQIDEKALTIISPARV